MLMGPATSPPRSPSTSPALSDSNLTIFRPALTARFSRRVRVDGVSAAVDVRVAAGKGGVGIVMGKGRGVGMRIVRGGLGREKLDMVR